jgi:hypothetical protein
MMKAFGSWLVVAACFLGLSVCRAEDAPAPTPQQPPAFVLPPPPNYAASSEAWTGSPLLDRPDAAPPGWFLNVESSVVLPHFQNQLVGGRITLAQTSGSNVNQSIGIPPGAGLPITGDVVNFPGNPLNATVTPRFEMGYRLPDGFGELKLGYRLMDTSGSDTLIDGNLGTASQNGHLKINFFDLDYATREFSLGPDWELRATVGIRSALLSYDSQISFLNPVAAVGEFGTMPFTRLSEAESIGTWYLGAHAVVEVDRKLPVPGLALFGRVDFSGLYGRTHQTFSETFVEIPGSTEIKVYNSLGTPMLTTQVGLSWDVPNWNHCRFMLGYQFEEWWQVGRGDNNMSEGSLYDQGVFLRAEFNF